MHAAAQRQVAIPNPPHLRHHHNSRSILDSGFRSHAQGRVVRQAATALPLQFSRFRLRLW